MKKRVKKNSDFARELLRHHFRVAIFGSARIRKGGPHYELVRELAKQIGHRGVDVVTGGGPGLMEAANTGHHEGRGHHHNHSIGLRIKLPFEEKAAPHLDLKREFSQFSRRLDEFMHLSHVVVIAPGGVGTLLEFAYTWQLIQVSHICEIPIIMIGTMWSGLMKWLKQGPLKEGLISLADLKYLYYVRTTKEAIKIIDKAHVAFIKNKGECRPMKRVGF